MRKLIIVLFAASQLFTACQKQLDYKLQLPVYEITNLLPADNAVFDLNDIDVNEYVFSWKAENPVDQLLVISEDPMLANPISIEVGKSDSYRLSALELDVQFVKLNITSGREKTLYWSVKDKSDPSKASREINTFVGRRAVSKLKAPEDLTPVVVYRDQLAETISFEWNAEGMEPAETYTLCMSLSQDFSSGVYEIEVGSSNPASVTYEKMQEVYESFNVPLLETAVMYWNVKADSKDAFLSRSSSIIYLDGILEFTDVRGDESITYRVAKLRYSNGTTVTWLADNLRTAKYPDGTDISKADYIQLDDDTSAERFLAYGRLYSIAVSKKVTPQGWRIPTVSDYQDLFAEARKVPGGPNVLKDDRWYGTFPRENGHVNEWRMNFNTPGRWPDSAYEIWGYNQKYLYLIVSDMDDRVINHDNDPQLWYSPNRGAALRLIYVGNKK